MLRFAIATFAAVFVLQHTAAFGASILKQVRTVAAAAVVYDLDPEAFDEDADHATSADAGIFLRKAVAQSAGNANFSAAGATQETIVDSAALAFSGSGSAGGNSETNFNDLDFLFDAWVSDTSRSTMEIVFSVAMRGSLHFSGILGVSGTGRGSGAVGQAIASVLLVDAVNGTVVWSRVVNSGSSSFDADVALQAGRYRLVVEARQATTDDGWGHNVTAAAAEFSIDGRIVENR